MKLFSKNNLRVIISLLLAFILCIAVFLLATVSTLFITTNKAFVLKSAADSGYAKQAYSELVQDLNYLAVPSGLPDNFFDDKIDFDEFEKSFFDGLTSTVSPNEKIVYNFDDVKTDVLNLITEYSKNVTDELSPETEKSLQDFSMECISIYSSYANPSLINYVFSLFPTIEKYLVFVLIAAVILGLAAGFTLFKINDVSSSKKYFFASFMGASLTVGIIPLFLILTNEISKLAITSKSLHAITTCFITDVLWVMIITAVILALISMMIILFNKIKLLIFKR